MPRRDGTGPMGMGPMTEEVLDSAVIDFMAEEIALEEVLDPGMVQGMDLLRDMDRDI